jgi:hypothetical protein
MIGIWPTAEPCCAAEHRDLYSEDVMTKVAAGARRQGMWEHRCGAEQAVMLVGHGEPCSWCGRSEGSGAPGSDAHMQRDATNAAERQASEADALAA